MQGKESTATGDLKLTTLIRTIEDTRSQKDLPEPNLLIFRGYLGVKPF